MLLGYRMSAAALFGALSFAAPSVTLAAGKSPEAASAAEKKEAGDLYTSAMTEFEADRYDAALKGFRQSYDVVKSPNSHFMIARSLARLGRNVEAYAELQAVIEEANALGGKYEDTVTAAHAKEDEIRPRVGLLTVVPKGLPKGTTFTVGGETVAASDLGKPRPVDPGNTVVGFTTPSGGHGEKTAHFEGGDSVEIELTQSLLPHEAPPDQGAFIEHDHHPHRLFELEAHLALETLEPPDRAVRGVGPGGRVTVPLIRKKLLPGLNDELGVTAGADWIGTSNDPHVLVPVALQYAVWVTPQISAVLEPGGALLFGAGTTFFPVLAVGIRCRLVSQLHFVGKLGIPVSTIGLSWGF